MDIVTDPGACQQRGLTLGKVAKQERQQNQSEKRMEELRGATVLSKFEEAVGITWEKYG